jgi:hypothetical protein
MIPDERWDWYDRRRKRQKEKTMITYNGKPFTDEAERRARIEAGLLKPEPKDYKHIAAWGGMLGSFQYYITREQEKAAAAGAPLDVIYFQTAEQAESSRLCGVDCHAGWHRFSEVTNPSTLFYFKQNFPDLCEEAPAK